jgi:hypothetical protein
MAKIFISYSRVDYRFVEGLAEKLRRAYNAHDSVWFDKELTGGDIWWEEILNQIATQNIFIYVLSNESVQSDYCQAEFEEARRLQKWIITVQARDRTKRTPELSDIHYIDMTGGVNDGEALTELFRSINKYKASKRDTKPLWEPPTPKPSKIDDNPRPEDAPDVDTPTLQDPRPTLTKDPNRFKIHKRGMDCSIQIVIGLFTTVIGGIILAYIIQDARFASDVVPGANNLTPALFSTSTDTLTSTPSSTVISTWTSTPTIDTLATAEARITETAVAAGITATSDARATESRSTDIVRDTATAEVQQTSTQSSIDETATADMQLTETVATATIEAQRTVQAVSSITERARQTATQRIVDETATASVWADTPSPTSTEDVVPVCERQADNLFAFNWDLWQTQCAPLFVRYIDLVNNEVVSNVQDIDYGNARYIRLILVPCVNSDGTTLDNCPFYITELITREQFNNLQSDPVDPVAPDSASSELARINPNDALNVCQSISSDGIGVNGRLLRKSEWVVLDDFSDLLNVDDIDIEAEITAGDDGNYFLNDGSTAYSGSSTGLLQPFRCVVDSNNIIIQQN